MKKRKTIQKITFSALALVMATAGILAFAPMGASASEPTTTTTGLGLDPKNDPIVYTTESGLEIRMSNANKFASTLTTTTNKGQTFTQDLTNFYYFTMGKFSGTIYTGANNSTTASYSVSNTPVNWLIIGMGSHSTAFIDSVSNYLFSTLKNNDYLFSNGEYFFQNQHETFSPAGELINSVINTKTYIMGKVKDSIPVHTDIPKGHMLVISEKLLGQMYFNGNGSINGGIYTSHAHGNWLHNASNSYGNRYRFLSNVSGSVVGSQTWTTSGNAGGSFYNFINNLFSKNTSGTILKNNLGFTNAEASRIVPQQLYTFYSNGPGYPLAETPATDGGTYYTMFPLAYRAEHTTKQNFCIEDYLNTDSKRVATLIGSNQSERWALRTGLLGYTSARNRMIYPNGSIGDDWVSYTTGVRPAMVMKLS